MSDSKVTQDIMKFVWQVEGERSTEDLRRVAIAKDWLDDDGAPTLGGRRLVESFELLRSVERDLM